MTTTTWIWLIIAVIYLAFFSWYTSFEGPLTEAEIGHYLELSKDTRSGFIGRGPGEDSSLHGGKILAMILL